MTQFSGASCLYLSDFSFDQLKLSLSPLRPWNSMITQRNWQRRMSYTQLHSSLVLPLFFFFADPPISSVASGIEQAPPNWPLAHSFLLTTAMVQFLISQTTICSSTGARVQIRRSSLLSLLHSYTVCTGGLWL